MVDRAFQDFLDSDDELFLEASHHFLDCNSTPSQQIPEENASHIQSEINTNWYLKYDDKISSEIQDNVSDATEMFSTRCEFAVKNIESASNSPIVANEHVNDIVTNSTTVPATLECNSDNISYLSKTPISCDNSSYIDSRFTPGFTPKAKKRKLPGPAGLFELFNASKEVETDCSEKMVDMGFQNIMSSQFTPECLSLISWRKLQTTVSSCPNLHSTVKHYSIQRVLQESAKKKLPKHMVVPFLCVLLKKLSNKTSNTTSVFMDDTGEINGKIDGEILSTYKEYLVEGTALILSKVTFLCNVLILKMENIVSIYHPNGTEKHPQDFDSILKTSEPLKHMNCECLKMVHHTVKDDRHKLFSSSSISSDHNLGCLNHNQNRFNVSDRNILSKGPDNNNMAKIHKVTSNQNKPNTVLNRSISVNKNISNMSPYKSPQITEASTHVKNVRSDAFLEKFLDEDNCIDEFDELLGNLDEKSFMEDL